MKKMIVLPLCVIALAAFASVVSAQEKAADEEVVALKKANYISARTIDFNKELGVPFAGLLTLGTRIDTAAKDLDPVSLAAAGLELKAAETAAGKTASYTSQKVLDRAVELATDRARPAELKAVKALLPEKAAEFDKLLTVLKRSEDETARGTLFVRVRNIGSEHCDILINGTNYGCIEEHRTETITFRNHIGDSHHVHIQVQADCGEILVDQTIHLSPNPSSRKSLVYTVNP
jgi:hypothetical protein